MTYEEQLEQKAEEIADLAMQGYDRLIPPEVLAEMRRILIADMLCSDDGRAQLRGCIKDPIVAKSEDVPRDAISSLPDPKTGSGDK